MATTIERTTEAAIPGLPAMPLLLSAKLFCAEGRRLVTLLSIDGLQVVMTTADCAVAQGIAVLARNGVRVSGEILWSDGQRLGLTLDAPLEAGLATALLGAGAPFAPRKGARHPLPEPRALA